MECFEKAIKIDPTYVEGWYYLGAAKEKLGDKPPGIMARQDFYQDAIQAFEEVIKIDQQNKVAWIHCGYCGRHPGGGRRDRGVRELDWPAGQQRQGALRRRDRHE